MRVEFSTSADRCQSKVDYKTEFKALKAVEKQKKLGRIRHAYLCPHCAGWHLSKLSREEWINRKNEISFQLSPKVFLLLLKKVFRFALSFRDFPQDPARK